MVKTRSRLKKDEEEQRRLFETLPSRDELRVLREQFLPRVKESRRRLKEKRPLIAR